MSYSELSLKKNKKSGKKRDSQDIAQYAVTDDDSEFKVASGDDQFQKVYFDYDRTNIKDDQRVAVDYDVKLARQVTAEGDAALMVIGKADTKCKSELYNTAVSQHRADVVKQEFALAGIDSDRIKALGVGDTQLEVPVYGAEPRNRCAMVQVVRG